MTAESTEARYQVIVTRNRQRSDRFDFQFARYRRPDEPGPRLELLGDVAAPECTAAQARELALAWLRLTRLVPVPEYALEFVWAPVEPGAEPVGDVGGTVHYARMRAPWWRRVVHR